MDEIICNCFDNRMLIECSPVLGHMSSLMHSGLVGQTVAEMVEATIEVVKELVVESLDTHEFDAFESVEKLLDTTHLDHKLGIYQPFDVP